jgi:DNA-directed RNA polymerase subunit RPC12/RpoP
LAEDKKKKTDYFPDFDYRLQPIVFDDKEMEGIQGPVYRPSGEIMHLGDSDTVRMEQPAEVFHDGDAKVYELSGSEFDLESAKEDQVLGYVPCPKCDSQIPIKSEKRPLKIRCPNCGKKGKLE